MQIDQMLVISTAHVKRETMEALRLPPGADGAVQILSLPWEWGRILWVDADYINATAPKQPEEKGWPKDLHEPLLLAERQGCQWLRLDDAARLVSGLPVYKRR
jgi:hypothetical protein